jgi:hypothetical protein
MVAEHHLVTFAAVRRRHDGSSLFGSHGTLPTRARWAVIALAIVYAGVHSSGRPLPWRAKKTEASVFGPTVWWPWPRSRVELRAGRH